METGGGNGKENHEGPIQMDSVSLCIFKFNFVNEQKFREIAQLCQNVRFHGKMGLGRRRKRKRKSDNGLFGKFVHIFLPVKI